jgi:hypothetical protein
MNIADQLKLEGMHIDRSAEITRLGLELTAALEQLVWPSVVELQLVNVVRVKAFLVR